MFDGPVLQTHVLANSPRLYMTCRALSNSQTPLARPSHPYPRPQRRHHTLRSSRSTPGHRERASRSASSRRGLY